MSDKTGIEWTDATWNPVTGCDQISPGCDHCYAKTLAGKFWPGQYPTNEDGSPRAFEQVWMHPDRLGVPEKWKAPRRVFVNSMSDLFHEAVTDEFIAQIFGAMASAKRHQFQVLTKRPKRMRDLLRTVMFPYQVRLRGHLEWPLPNVWLGTSIELDRYAWRADYLRQTPAAVRFISAEPLLGPLPRLDLAGIDWLITGGESGAGHRPCDPEWVRDLRDRCQAAGVAFFHKQWGGLTPKSGGRLLDGREWSEFPTARATVTA